MNNVALVGNLTRDIEIRYTQSGSAISNTGIAVNKKWKSASGEQKEKVMFIDLTFFGRQAEIANQYLKKGSKVGIVGELDFQTWSGQDGVKRSKHSISVSSLDMISTSTQNSQPNYSQQQPDYSQQQPGYGQQQPDYSQQQPDYSQQQPGYGQQQQMHG